MALTAEPSTANETAADAAWRDIVRQFEDYRSQFGEADATALAGLLLILANEGATTQ
jgi:hypothetical protein